MRGRDPRSSGSLAEHLALLLAKSAEKEAAVVLGDEVPEIGLASELVDTLGDLVAGGVAETREEGEELLAGGGLGRLTEDNRVDVAEVNLS